MAFEKPTGNPNCEATEHGCTLCVTLGIEAARRAFLEVHPD